MWTIEPLTLDRAAQTTIQVLEECSRRVRDFDPSDWSRWTKLRGWRMADLIWHIARAAARNAEIVRRTVDNLGPLPEISDWGLPHPNDAVPPPDTAALLEHLDASHHALAARVAALDESQADLTVPTAASGGPSLRHWLSSYVMEFGIHQDDLHRALEIDVPLNDDVLTAIYARAPRMALEHAASDGLQPVAPRNYRLIADRCDIDFHWNTAWRPGLVAEAPTATIIGDDLSIARLLTGRASVGEPPQRLDGAWHLALDLPRWCGVW